MPSREPKGEQTKKTRPKDVFGRPLPTEEEFEVLKNAPRYVSKVASALLITGNLEYLLRARTTTVSLAF